MQLHCCVLVYIKYLFKANSNFNLLLRADQVVRDITFTLLKGHALKFMIYLLIGSNIGFGFFFLSKNS